jgi:MinD-like ATPase involved in chromosome partitioning or flagellar assembly
VVAKLPDDAVLVTRSINEGVPFVQSAPAHPLSVEIGKLAQWIMKGDSEKVEEIDPQIVQARKGIGRFMPPMAKRKAG